MQWCRVSHGLLQGQVGLSEFKASFALALLLKERGLRSVLIIVSLVSDSVCNINQDAWAKQRLPGGRFRGRRCGQDQPGPQVHPWNLSRFLHTNYWRHIQKGEYKHSNFDVMHFFRQNVKSVKSLNSRLTASNLRLWTLSILIRFVISVFSRFNSVFRILLGFLVVDHFFKINQKLAVMHWNAFSVLFVNFNDF